MVGRWEPIETQVWETVVTPCDCCGQVVASASGSWTSTATSGASAARPARSCTAPTSCPEQRVRFPWLTGGAIVADPELGLVEWREGVRTRLHAAASTGAAQLCVMEQWAEPGRRSPSPHALRGRGGDPRRRGRGRVHRGRRVSAGRRRASRSCSPRIAGTASATPAPGCSTPSPSSPPPRHRSSTRPSRASSTRSAASGTCAATRTARSAGLPRAADGDSARGRVRKRRSPYPGRQGGDPVATFARRSDPRGRYRLARSYRAEGDGIGAQADDLRRDRVRRPGQGPAEARARARGDRRARRERSLPAHARRLRRPAGDRGGVPRAPAGDRPLRGRRARRRGQHQARPRPLSQALRPPTRRTVSRRYT